MGIFGNRYGFFLANSAKFSERPLRQLAWFLYFWPERGGGHTPRGVFGSPRGGGGSGFLGSPHPRHRRFSCGKIHPYPLKLHFCLPLRPAPFLTIFDHFLTPKKTPNLDPHFGGGPTPPLFDPPLDPPLTPPQNGPPTEGKNSQEKPSIRISSQICCITITDTIEATLASRMTCPPVKRAVEAGPSSWDENRPQNPF